MVDPSAERKERRNWWVGVAVITAFVLLGSGSLGYSLYEPSAAAEPSTPDEPTPMVQLLKASFVDQMHGHLIVATCEDSRDTNTCGTELRVTADGGQTWTKRALPRVNGGNPIGVDDNAVVYSLGIDRIVLDVPGSLDSTSGLLSAPGHRYFTGDGGRTWEERPRKPTGTVTEVPANGSLIYPVPDPADRPTKAGAGVAPQVLKADGTAALLADGPTYESVPSLPAISATDGSIWAVAATPASVSHDRGRTWQPIKLPKLASGTVALVRTADGKNAYLITATDAGLAGLYSSTDGTKSWHKLSLPKSNAGSPGAEGFAESPDGSFLLLFDSKLYRYATGETSPEEMQLTGGLSFTQLAVGDHAVVLRSGESEESMFFVTVNGSDLIPVSQRVGG